jgi:hypothetical protein
MLNELSRAHLIQFGEGGAEGRGKELSGSAPIFLGTSGGFGDDRVDELEIEEIAGGEAEGCGGEFCFAGVPPDDGGAGFWADDAVDGIFQHEDSVGDAECEGTAGAAFADDDGDDGYAEAGHFPEVNGDGFSLAAFFGVDAGIGTGGVEEAEDRAVKLGGELHTTEGFPVAFRLGHGKVPLELLLGVAALLVADYHYRLTIEEAVAAHDGSVVAVGPVAVDFLEIGDESFEVIKGMGTLGMASELDSLPSWSVRQCSGFDAERVIFLRQRFLL